MKLSDTYNNMNRRNLESMTIMIVIDHLIALKTPTGFTSGLILRLEAHGVAS
jgi:hypothetical protein